MPFHHLNSCKINNNNNDDDFDDGITTLNLKRKEKSQSNKANRRAHFAINFISAYTSNCGIAGKPFWERDYVSYSKTREKRRKERNNARTIQKIHKHARTQRTLTQTHANTETEIASVTAMKMKNVKKIAERDYDDARKQQWNEVAGHTDGKEPCKRNETANRYMIERWKGSQSTRTVSKHFEINVLDRNRSINDYAIRMSLGSQAIGPINLKNANKWTVYINWFEQKTSRRSQDIWALGRTARKQ